MSKTLMALLIIVIGALLGGAGIIINKKGITYPGADKEYMKVKAVLNISIGVISIILGIIMLILPSIYRYIQYIFFGLIILILILDTLLRKTVK